MHKRLLGTWRSDKRKTLEHWGDYQRAPLSQRRKSAFIFGKLTLRYTPRLVHSEFLGSSSQDRYDVVAENYWGIVVRIHQDSNRRDLDAFILDEFPEFTEPRLVHIEFEEGKVERYRVPMGFGATNLEWFRRVA